MILFFSRVRLNCLFGENLMENSVINNSNPMKFTHLKSGLAARFINFFMKRIVVGKTEFIFHDEKPENPSVFIANHTRAKGPLAIQYLYPGYIRTWSNAKLVERKSCYDQFKNNIIKNIRGERLFRLLLPIGVPIVNWYYKKQLNCIPVYHDMNVVKTFNTSVETLINGVNVAIYPEVKETVKNEVISNFATGFSYLGFYYYRKTGKLLQYYPVYIALTLRQIHFGKPIAYNPEIPMKEQSLLITEYLENSITELARSLPPHKIITVYGDYKVHADSPKN